MRIDLVYLDPRLIEESALSKTAAAVAMLLAFGVGGKMISRMLAKNGIHAEPAAVEAMTKDPKVRQEADRIRQERTQQPQRAARAATVQRAQPQPTMLSTQDYMEFIEPFEGRSHSFYYDSRGVPTIGVGFNLQRADAGERLAAGGTSLQAVLNGQALTDDHIDDLFEVTTREAETVARRFVPNFDELPDNVKRVMVSMAFTLGPNRLAGFDELRGALVRGDMAAAADEIVNSEWFYQTGDRGPHHANQVRGSATTGSTVR